MTTKIPCRYITHGLSIDPKGDVKPCCVWQGVEAMPGISYISQNNTKTINQIYHGNRWSDIRKWFVNNDTLPPMCNVCSNIESTGNKSPRLLSYDLENEEIQKQAFENINKKTGQIDKNYIDFIDIRFSNLCNLKCRMCVPECSSLLAEEDGINPSYTSWASSDFLQLIFDILPQVRTIYFAGGEPLLAKEHYQILEELIRIKHFNINICYNSNGTVLQYKNKDLFELWKDFKNIDFLVSLDHYGERAEYIRHPCDWSKVEKNLLRLKHLKNVSTKIITTIQLYNYCTYNEFHEYMKQSKFAHIKSLGTSLLSYPNFYSIKVLPSKYKIAAKKSISNIINLDKDNSICDFSNYADSDDLWDTLKDKLREEILYRDKLRNEDFCKTFPELKGLLND